MKHRLVYSCRQSDHLHLKVFILAFCSFLQVWRTIHLFTDLLNLSFLCWIGLMKLLSLKLELVVLKHSIVLFLQSSSSLGSVTVRRFRHLWYSNWIHILVLYLLVGNLEVYLVLRHLNFDHLNLLKFLQLHLTPMLSCHSLHFHRLPHCSYQSLPQMDQHSNWDNFVRHFQPIYEEIHL